MSIKILDITEIIAFWLCFTRWLTTMIQLPVFDNTSVPSIVKVLGSLVITFAFFPILKTGLIAEVQTYGADYFWYLTIFHSAVGLMIGYLVKSIMAIFISSGALMSQQIGFGSVAYYDPTFQSQVGPLEKIIQWTVLILILSTGALLPMFKGVMTSFSSITFFSFDKLGTSPEFFQVFFKGLFSSAILLATPILFTNFLLNFVLGIIARTVPQMNVLMVSFVVNIGIGLVVFLAVSEEFFQVAYKMYVDQLANWFQYLT